MKYLLFFFFTIIASVNASSHFLAPRQAFCRQGGKVCGSNCILESDSCCLRFSTGCRPGTYCHVGSDGVIGCCRNGRICNGPGAGISVISDEPTATYDGDSSPTTSEDPAPTADEDSAPINNEDSAPTADEPTATKSTETHDPRPTSSGSDNAGTSNRLDIAVTYLVVGAMMLLI